MEITGTAIVGEAVYAKVSPAAATVTYQWQRGKRITEFADIAGANGSSYILTEDDHDIMVRVVVKGTGSYTGTAASDAIEPAWDPVTAKINEGWIPIANKQELKQIEESSENTFGAGTKWEGTYTGGMDKKYMLVTDIDLEGDNFIPIGYDEADTASDFTGALSGEGYTIQNLTIDRDRELQGLFSRLGSDAQITGVRLENASITAKSRFGALAGEAEGAVIEDCAVSGVNLDVSSKAADLDYANRYIGGLVGKSASTRYANDLVENLAMVVHEPEELNNYFMRNVGGVTGLMDGGSISDTRAEGIHIEIVNDELSPCRSAIFASGGLAGELQNTSDETLTVDNCTVSNLALIVGAVAAAGSPFPYGAGGLIGVSDTVNSGVPTNGDIVIKNSGASGLIQGKGNFFAAERVGGFIGYADGTNAPSGYITIENCAASVDISKLDINPSYCDVYAQNGPTGGFASKLIKTKVTNCYAYGDLDSAFLMGGGFAGWIEDSYVDLCGAEGDVLGNFGVSGFAFYIANSEVTRCYASGLVGGNDDPEQLGALPLFTGGFAFEISGSTLSDNYFAGQMEETQNNGGAGLGGGFVCRTSNAVIQHAYVSGNVANSCGFAFQITGSDTDISGCYYNITENPSSTAVYDNSSSGTVEIEGKTDEELKQIATFAGWDISEEGAGEDTLWLIKEGEKYPYFNPDYVFHK